MVVSDAGPIISFARSGYGSLLQKVLIQLTIPKAVYTEVVIKGRSQPGASFIQESSWIKQVTIPDPLKVNFFPANLGRGEREAIILAEEYNTSLLIDDRIARREATNRGIECFGSLRVLKEAKTVGIIEAVRPIADALKVAGLHLNDVLYETFLQDMQE